MRRKAIISALSGGALLLVIALTIWSQQPPPPIARPSDTPSPVPTESPTPTVTPSPSPSPSPSPTRTASPRPTRTPRPQPTSNTAGLQLLPYYFSAQQALSAVLPSGPRIELDEAADVDGDARFRGLTPTGIPMFSVREDFVMTPRTAYHEIGHAFEELLKLKLSGVDVRARYWAFRGFPGTWQDAAAEAARRSGTSQWMVLPGESWAEAFSIAMVGSGQEKTLDYGKTIDPAATKAFFLSLAAEAAP
jgi:hypothetical protein